jgi:hypothetical protein
MKWTQNFVFKSGANAREWVLSGDKMATNLKWLPPSANGGWSRAWNVSVVLDSEMPWFRFGRSRLGEVTKTAWVGTYILYKIGNSAVWTISSLSVAAVFLVEYAWKMLEALSHRSGCHLKFWAAFSLHPSGLGERTKTSSWVSILNPNIRLKQSPSVSVWVVSLLGLPPRVLGCVSHSTRAVLVREPKPPVQYQFLSL